MAGKLGALTGIVGLSAITGLLATAMVTPALAVTGMTMNNSIGIFENLPEYIQPDVLAQKTNIYALDSAENPVLLASVFAQNREEVGWDQISQFAKDAVIATEDPRFYTHGGVDVASTLRAAVGNVSSGGIESGASTISMQYVKNILVQRAEAENDLELRAAAYEEAAGTSIDRKLREMKLAIGLEKEFTKDEILLGYLNIAGFGGQTYGIQSAAMLYYGVSAADLTVAQAASLIAIVNQPNGLRIDNPDNIAANQARRDRDVLPSMLRENRITKAQFDEAMATPVTPVITRPSTGCQTANELGAGFFCDYVSRTIANQSILGEDENGTANTLRRGGYDIFTTLDVDLQVGARDSTNANVPKSSNVLDVGSSLVTVEPGTGRILAMAQNKDFNADPENPSPEATALNYSTDQASGGSTGFQVGSTYKVFTLAEWLEQGNSLSDRVNGNRQTWDPLSFRDSCQGPGLEPYTPRNDGGASPGMTTVQQATTSSTNNAYLAMAQQLDQCEIRKTAEAFGVDRADGNQLTSFMSDVLGTNEIAPLDMAAAFAGISNNGIFCEPIAIDRIVDANGNEIPVPQTDCRPAVSPEVAATMAFALTSVVTGGTGSLSNPRNGIPHFGKTGTTDSQEDTWFVGASSNLATAVWVGNVEGAVSMGSISGGTSLRHSVWRQYTTIADAKYGGDAFPAPDQAMVRGIQLPVPDVTGLTLQQARTAIEANGFEFRDGGAVPSAAEPGTVERTTPTGTASRGALITVFYSDGSLAVTEPDEIDEDDSAPGQPTPRPTAPPAASGTGLGVLR